MGGKGGGRRGGRKGRRKEGGRKQGRALPPQVTEFTGGLRRFEKTSSKVDSVGDGGMVGWRDGGLTPEDGQVRLRLLGG